MSLSFGRDLEFRVFLPVVSPDNSDHANYREKLNRLVEDFTITDGVTKEFIDVTPMVYCVGGCHWGVKYRGPDRKLEVKYRKSTIEIGGCTKAVEQYKKKKFGKVTLREKKAKLLEKLKQHCHYEHNKEEEDKAVKAIDAERLIALDKQRKEFYHGGVSIDFAYLTVNMAQSTFQNTSIAEGSPWRDSVVLEQESGEETTESDQQHEKETAAKAGAVGVAVEWISVAFEGNYDTIVEAIHSNFDVVAACMSEGLKQGLPVMVGGYPTFVSLVGNGLTYGDDCDEIAYGTYQSTMKGPADALLAYHAANRKHREMHAKEETNAYYVKGEPRMQLH